MEEEKLFDWMVYQSGFSLSVLKRLLSSIWLEIHHSPFHKPCHSKDYAIFLKTTKECLKKWLLLNERNGGFSINVSHTTLFENRFFDKAISSEYINEYESGLDILNGIIFFNYVSHFNKHFNLNYENIYITVFKLI